MQDGISAITKMLNYLFPLHSYAGEKITDRKWMKFFMPRPAQTVPFFAIGIGCFIVFWGLIAHPDRPFFTTVPGGICCLLIFCLSMLFLFIRFLKKRNRSPALAFLMAHVVALQCLLGTFLLSRLTSYGQEKIGKAAFSQSVQDRLQGKKVFLDQKFETPEREFEQVFATTRDVLQDRGKRSRDHFELSRKALRDSLDKRWKGGLTAREVQWKTLQEAHFKSTAEQVEKFKERRNASWDRRGHRLFTTAFAQKELTLKKRKTINPCHILKRDANAPT